LAQVTKDLLAGLLPVQRLQPGPLLQLSLADKSQHGLGKDRPLAVEAIPVHSYVAVGEKLGLNDGFEGPFVILPRHAASHTRHEADRPTFGFRRFGYIPGT